VGLDAAYGLLEMGKKPTVIDVAESVLSVNLDPYAAGIYQKKFEEAGCKFRLGAKVTAVLWNGDVVKGIVLDGKDAVPCDLLIVAVGIRPAIAFLADSGITCERGVKVDKHLATNVPGVYAAGDAAGLSVSWPSAMNQGDVAALNMLGVSTEYDEILALKNTVNFFGIPSLSVGQFIPTPEDVVNSREDRGRYQKVVIRNGVPVGVILQGDISRSGFWQYIISHKISVADIPKSVWKVSFADNYSLEKNGEYKWAV